MVSNYLSIVYATDEDVCVIGGADFGVIVPQSNLLAQASDGAIGSPDLWTLSSASSNFTIQGVKAGNVVQFSGTGFSPRQYLAVETVGTNTLTLRRCGMSVGVGLPPVPTASSGLTFSIATLNPQIEDTAFKLNEAYAVDPNVVNRTPGDIYDERIFRRLTVFRVLYQQYMNLNRSKAGDFADKQGHYKAEFDGERASAALRWGPQGVSQPPTTFFGTRLSR